MIIQNYYRFLVVISAFVVLTSWCQQESSALQVVLLRPGAGAKTQNGAHAASTSRERQHYSDWTCWQHQ